MEAVSPPETVVTISAYVCPTPGCGNYFGSCTMPDLTKEYSGPKTENRHQVPAAQSPVGIEGVRHTRAACPDCRGRGLDVERRLVTVNVRVPS